MISKTTPFLSYPWLLGTSTPRCTICRRHSCLLRVFCCISLHRGTMRNCARHCGTAMSSPQPGKYRWRLSQQSLGGFFASLRTGFSFILVYPVSGGYDVPFIVLYLSQAYVIQTSTLPSPRTAQSYTICDIYNHPLPPPPFSLSYSTNSLSETEDLPVICRLCDLSFMTDNRGKPLEIVIREKLSFLFGCFPGNHSGRTGYWKDRAR